MDWYEDAIEEPIRSAVKLLRDNGFNTTCSCGHEREIECDVSPDGEFKRLHDLLCGHGYRRYRITFDLLYLDGCPFSTISISFNPKV